MRVNSLLCLAAFTFASVFSARATTIDNFVLTFNTPGPIVSSPNPYVYNFTQLKWSVVEPVFSVIADEQGVPGLDLIVVFVDGAESRDPIPTGYVYAPPPGYAGLGVQRGGFTQNPAPGAPSFLIVWEDSPFLAYHFTETGPSITQGTFDDPTFAPGTYTFTSGTVNIDEQISTPDFPYNDLNLTTAGDTLVITKEEIPDVPEPSSLVLLGSGLIAACGMLRQRII